MFIRKKYLIHPQLNVEWYIEYTRTFPVSSHLKSAFMKPDGISSLCLGEISCRVCWDDVGLHSYSMDQFKNVMLSKLNKFLPWKNPVFATAVSFQL